jgi:hypothetical protein
MPTESSVADQMVRFTPSQVGSRVFRRALSSTVLKMEHNVALGAGLVQVLMCSEEMRQAYIRPRQKTSRSPHCTFDVSCTVERYIIGATT